jgi:HPt (histidine-containing phosphotransfer) domain-containing protein/DNA-binding NarL/FixJ family response regulator
MKKNTLFAQQYPLRILLAEDNVTNQKVALSLLKRIGYSADVVENGAKAVQALARQFYDVILMDIQMPEMDGLEATKYIREHWETPAKSPYIIAVTAHAIPGYRDLCLEAGMNDYITKPVRQEELKAALTRSYRSINLQADKDTNHSNDKATEKPDLISANDSSLKIQILSTLHELVGGYEPIIKDLIQTYLDSSATLISELQAAIVHQNPTQLEHSAHSLKSSSASLGANVLSDLCRQLEQQGRVGEMSNAQQKVQRVLSEYALVSQALNSILNNQDWNEDKSQKSELITDDAISKPQQFESSKITKNTTESSELTTAVEDERLTELTRTIQKTLFSLIGEDDPELFAELIQTYRNEGFNLMNRLREAVANGDANQLSQVAHSLKSSSANLGASQLANDCKTLEQQGKNHDLADSATTFAQLEIEYQRVIKALDILSSPKQSTNLMADSISQAVPERTPQTEAVETEKVALLAQQIQESLISFLGEKDVEMIKSLAKSYQESSNTLIKSLRQAVAQHDAHELTKSAHTLKSSSCYLGTHQLVDLCISLEKLGKAGKMDDVTTALLAQLEEEYLIVGMALEKLAEQKTEGPCSESSCNLKPSSSEQRRVSTG